MSEQNRVSVTLEQLDGFSFIVRFDATTLPSLHTDEPAPLGHDSGPNPSRLLVSAVANCLSASLLFALQKFKNTPEKIITHADATLARNSDNRWRIAQINVTIQLGNEVAELHNFDRIAAQFEEFCIVTQSVRDGIAVNVTVQDKSGAVVHHNQVN